MKMLPDKFEEYGYTYERKKRVGMTAIYKKVKTGKTDGVLQVGRIERSNGKESWKPSEVFYFTMEMALCALARIAPRNRQSLIPVC